MRPAGQFVPEYELVQASSEEAGALAEPAGFHTKQKSHRRVPQPKSQNPIPLCSIVTRGGLAMIDGPAMITALERSGFTHLVWIPDSHLGAWDAALAQSRFAPIRAVREGEAVAIAAGLMLGGAKPLVAIQCTGFFEAGDAVRNVVRDLKLPLKLLVGVRSWRAKQAGTTADNCPTYAEPLVKAWDLPCAWFDPFTNTDCTSALKQLADAESASVLLWGE